MSWLIRDFAIVGAVAGATTVLCTDKTGTLTEHRMTIVTLRGADGRWDKDSDRGKGSQPVPRPNIASRLKPRC
jgi:magnesium-transporting ATPase (P-type)